MKIQRISILLPGPLEKTVEKRTELIMGRLDEKYCLEEEKLHTRIEVLENQIISKSQEFAELSKELEVVKQKLEHTERSLSTEHQNNVKNRQEWSRLKCADLYDMASLQVILADLISYRTASRLEKENSKLEESKSKHLDQAQQDTKSLKPRLRDQQSVILELQARETVNEANKETIRISTEDSNLAKQLFQDALELKEVIRKIEATLDDAKKENLALRKDISVKEEELIQQLVPKFNSRKIEYARRGRGKTRQRAPRTSNPVRGLEFEHSLMKEELLPESRKSNNFKNKVANLMVKNSEGKDNANLQARLHTTQDALDHSKAKASAAREKAVATMERKYEVILMNANNEKKRLAKQLGDSESRLLAMSAELAKSKGKPSLEEVFQVLITTNKSHGLCRSVSKSANNKSMNERLKMSQLVASLRSNEPCRRMSWQKSGRVNSDENVDFKDHKRDHQEKVIGITQKTVMTSKVKLQPKCEEGVSKAEAAPKSSRRTAMPVTRSTKKAGVKKQSKRS
ncbi:hypothetical protein KEM48_012820 [Puccinia striiformis f. sp. tritici PST-130]|nr:hypothetical protein KEM48_012820 [Puccinia striiformis f. sp. tritici PST-130]